MKSMQIDTRGVIIINKILSRTKDDVTESFEAIEVWVNDIYSRTAEQSKIIRNVCEVCGKQRHSDCSFERHHVAGEKHDFRTITVCKGCHRELSQKQKLRDARWLTENQSENVRLAFFLWGLYDILDLKSKKGSDSHYGRIAYRLIDDIAELLKS